MEKVRNDRGETLLVAGEWVLIASGLLFLASTLYIYLGGDFAIHYGAKILYVIGIVIFLVRN